MNRKISLSVIALLLLSTTMAMMSNSTQAFACPPCGINLIVNGGFEEPVVTNSYKWDVFSSVPGWTIQWMPSVPDKYQGYDRPAPTLELQLSGVQPGWSAAEGNQYAELDSDWFHPLQLAFDAPSSVMIYQDISTTPWRIYILSFAFSPRPGYDGNQLRVWWGSSVIDTISGTGLASTTWTYYMYTLRATGLHTRVKFEEIGPADSLGSFLDDVSLVVPCPGAGPSPGYWKNYPDAWAATGYSTGDQLQDVFGPYAPATTLMGALQLHGGGVNAFARQAVAALLNAASGPYPLTTAEVINLVTTAYNSQNAMVISTLKSLLESYNSL